VWGVADAAVGEDGKRRCSSWLVDREKQDYRVTLNQSFGMAE
jgi:hypothetical protein